MAHAATRLASVAGLAVIFTTLVGCAQQGAWKSVTTGETKIWRSDHGPWRAEVDPSRGRLTFLGKADGKNLLLNPTPPPSDLEFGGHRVWLGPQSEWPIAWPPPKNWESQPADLVRRVTGGALEVKSPDAPGFPSIRRTYRWADDGVLVCSASWRETTLRGRQAIHILQIAEGMTITAKPEKSTSAPHGYIKLPIAHRPEIQTRFSHPIHATKSGRWLHIRRKNVEEKFGFPVQSLVASGKDLRLRMHAGQSRGVVTEYPDRGFLTQIYLGSNAWPVTEIEQLSPRLTPKNPGGTVEFSVALELEEIPARICN